MTTTMTLPMAEMPSVISESVAAVLKSHGFVLAEQVPLMGAPFFELRALNVTQAGEVLVEVGKNAAQCLMAIDESLDTSPQPDAGTLLQVGHTLRMLARTAPGQGTGAALAQVGEWLVERAAEAMASAAKAKAAKPRIEGPCPPGFLCVHESKCKGAA